MFTAAENWNGTENFSINVNEGDLAGFIDAILKLESNDQLCQEFGQNGRNFVEKNHTFEIIRNNLSSIIQKRL